MTILVVEDNPELLEIVSTILQEDGYTCLTATSVTRAISHLEANSTICLVLLDLQLGADWGSEVIKYMNRFDRYRHVPILICSGLGKSEQVVEMIRMGAKDYILKPFRLNILLKKIQKLLQANCGTIVVASNEPMRINLLQRILTNHNFLVYPLTTGHAALAQLQTNPPPGMLIADLQLPDMYGLTLLADTRTHSPQTAVLMMTPRGAKKQFEQFIASGAHGFIRVPFNSAELIPTVESCYPEQLRGVGVPVQ